MTILSAQTIKALCLDYGMIDPFVDHKVVYNGTSYGLSSASYDVRIAHDLALYPGDCALAHTVEDLRIPNDVCCMVVDKSTYARRFTSAMNTFVDPGFKGNLTLELVNHSNEVVRIKEGSPICQLVFFRLDQPTDRPYDGKYQNQSKAAHPPRYEE